VRGPANSLILELMQQALYLVIVLSLPAIATAAAVGLIVALIQAVTQVQDHSISQSLKIVAVFLVILTTSAWIGHSVVTFAQRAISTILTL
jgi:type III secretion protein S